MRNFKPGVIVCREKHSTDLYWALTEEQLYKQALAIVISRYEAGWYYKPSKPSSPDLGMTAAEINALPEGSVKQEARKAYRRYERSLALYEQDVLDYNNLLALIEEQDGYEAWLFLRSRSSCEYEEVELVHPEGDIDE